MTSIKNNNPLILVSIYLEKENLEINKPDLYQPEAEFKELEIQGASRPSF